MPAAAPQPSAGEERRTRSLAATVRLLAELVRGLVRAGWQHRSIHLFGFSQGERERVLHGLLQGVLQGVLQGAATCTQGVYLYPCTEN